jgi:hypothetical protein
MLAPTEANFLTNGMILTRRKSRLDDKSLEAHFPVTNFRWSYNLKVIEYQGRSIWYTLYKSKVISLYLYGHPKRIAIFLKIKGN